MSIRSIIQATLAMNVGYVRDSYFSSRTVPGRARFLAVGVSWWRELGGHEHRNRHASGIKPDRSVDFRMLDV
jgi:hypothetical protein